MHRIITGVHTVSFVLFQRNVQHGVRVAVNQLGSQFSAGGVVAAHGQQHRCDGQHHHCKQDIGQKLFVLHGLLLPGLELLQLCQPKGGAGIAGHPPVAPG